MAPSTPEPSDSAKQPEKRRRLPDGKATDGPTSPPRNKRSKTSSAWWEGLSQEEQEARTQRLGESYRAWLGTLTSEQRQEQNRQQSERARARWGSLSQEEQQARVQKHSDGLRTYWAGVKAEERQARNQKISQTLRTRPEPPVDVAAANQTANALLGSRGRKYAWMNPGSAASSSTQPAASDGGQSAPRRSASPAPEPKARGRGR